jgi:hypothetical protein
MQQYSVSLSVYVWCLCCALLNLLEWPLTLEPASIVLISRLGLTLLIPCWQVLLLHCHTGAFLVFSHLCVQESTAFLREQKQRKVTRRCRKQSISWLRLHIMNGPGLLNWSCLLFTRPNCNCIHLFSEFSFSKSFIMQWTKSCCIVASQMLPRLYRTFRTTSQLIRKYLKRMEPLALSLISHA